MSVVRRRDEEETRGIAQSWRDKKRDQDFFEITKFKSRVNCDKFIQRRDAFLATRTGVDAS